MIYDAIVIGGGPAGLMASNVFEQNQINYILLEKNEKPGKKLLITGGKRCNVTNRLSIDDFISSLTMKHKRFLYPALTSFGTNDVIQYFKSNGLNLVLEDGLKYFPETNKSSSVLSALLSPIKPNHLYTKQSVKEIIKNHDTYKIVTETNSYITKHVVIATGSNSYPSTGSSGDGLVFASKLGLETIPFTPAETHVFSSEVMKTYADLQGVSIDYTTVKINGTKQKATGSLIFTHYGLSGPAIFHLSEDIYKELLFKKTSLSFNIVRQSITELREIFKKGTQKNLHILKILEQLTTKKLSKKILEVTNTDNKTIKELSNKNIEEIIDTLLNFTVTIDRVEDKEKAYVNAGGVHTKELDPKSMESKKLKNLYFIGETVDLHGPIGGFNITIALSTGYLCAHHIVQTLNQEK